MRTLITDYSIIGDYQIRINDAPKFQKNNVRLMVNETQRYIICASVTMKHSISVSDDNVITISEGLPVLHEGDDITIEIDFSGNGTWYTDGMTWSGQPDFLEFFADYTHRQSRSYQLLSVDSNITQISKDRAFYNCRQLTTVNLPELTYLAGYVFCYTAIETISLPKCKTFSGSALRAMETLKEAYLPMCNDCHIQDLFAGCTNLEKITYGTLTTNNGGGNVYGYGSTKLIDIIIGPNSTSNNTKLLLSTWNPTEAMLDSSSTLVKDGETFANNREKLLYNFREHFVSNLKDLTGETSKSITLSANMKTLVEADTTITTLLTSKNWTLA